VSEFIRHLERVSATVATWPEWKRNILGGRREAGVRCDKCGCDNAANDGPMTPCNECGRALCDECYGEQRDWCKSCRCLEDEGRRG
jgi:hypothetical protein